MSTLLLRLAGPLQSWGVQSRFPWRDTGREPSKSGVVGLLAAALGRPRTAALDDLAALRLGVRVDREGTLQVDYQTIGGSHRAGDTPGVAIANGSNPRPLTSRRYYLADADFLVGLESDDQDLLLRLDEALARPVWPLFLGRKAYVPGRPIRLGWRPAHLPGAPQIPGLLDLPLDQALERFPLLVRTPRERQRLQEQAGPGGLRLRRVMEVPLGSGNDVRPDQPVSFAILDRRYTLRWVQTDFVSLPLDLIQEDPHVSLPSPA